MESNGGRASLPPGAPIPPADGSSTTPLLAPVEIPADGLHHPVQGCASGGLIQESAAATTTADGNSPPLAGNLGNPHQHTLGAPPAAQDVWPGGLQSAANGHAGGLLCCPQVAATAGGPQPRGHEAGATPLGLGVWASKQPQPLPAAQGTTPPAVAAEDAGPSSLSCAAVAAATRVGPAAATRQHLPWSSQPSAAVATEAAGRGAEGGRASTPVQSNGAGQGVWSGAPIGAPSFAQILLKSTLPPTIQVAVHPPEVTDSGEPMASFSGEEMQLSCRPLAFTVLAKTPKGRPSFPEIRAHLALRFRFTADFVISPYDSAHLLIRFGNQEDYLKLLLRESMYIYGKPFRFLKWDWNFSPEIDSPIVPVWLELPRLSANFYCEPMIRSIAGSIGPVLQIDRCTLNMTKTHAAVVCVQLDVSKRLHDRVRINLPSGGFWQAIHYLEPPLYCHHCNRLGHSIANCRQQARLDGVRRNGEVEGQNQTQGAKPFVHEPVPPQIWRPAKQIGGPNAKQSTHAAPKGSVAPAQSESSNVGVGVSNSFEALTGLNSDVNDLFKGADDAVYNDNCTNAPHPNQNTCIDALPRHAGQLLDVLPPTHVGGDNCSDLSSCCLGVPSPLPQADLLPRNCEISPIQIGGKQMVQEPLNPSTVGSTESGTYTPKNDAQAHGTSPLLGERLVASRSDCNPPQAHMSSAPKRGETSQQPSRLHDSSGPATSKPVNTIEDLNTAEDHHDVEASLSTNSVAKPDGDNTETDLINQEVIITLPVMYDVISLPGLPPPTSDNLDQVHMGFARKKHVANQPRDRIKTRRGLCRSVSVPDLANNHAATKADVSPNAAAAPFPTYAQAVKSSSPAPPIKGRFGEIGPMASLNISPTMQPAGRLNYDTECSFSPATTEEDDVIFAKADRQRKKKKKGHTPRPPTFKMRSGLRRPRPLYRVGEEFMK